jgi:molybdate transport system substrate-binding protein
MKRWLAATSAALVVAASAGCGSDDSDGDDDGGGSTTLTVYAAASLTSSFEDLAEEFEADHDGVEVEFNFAGSSDLVAQIQQGAPADVFASADEASIEKVTDLVSDPQLFASNTLEIAVPPDNPAGVRSFQDLTKPDLNLVICAPDVPCGTAARTVADSAGVELEPVSEEPSVTDVLAKVTSGEADAGLVYVTDVIAAGDDVQGIEFPESSAAVNKYPIATIADSESADLAQEFVDLVLGETGQTILANAGFARP